MKFITDNVVRCQTQTNLEMCDDDLHGKRFTSSMPKTKIADQSSKETQEPQIETPESGNDTQTGREEIAIVHAVPTGREKAPATLNHYECEVERPDSS